MKTYILAGHACDCQDFAYGQAPDGWCQHRIAAGIAKRVGELLPALPVEPWPDNDPEDGPAPAVETVPPPAPPAVLPEAMFSVTLKGRLDGCEDAMLTVRAWSLAEFQANLAVVRGLIVTPASPPADTQGPGPGPGPDKSWCSKHGVHMPWNEGKEGKRGWYSHRHEGQWCKGK